MSSQAEVLDGRSGPMCDECCPHGPDEPCTCTGCWACDGHVVGCTCDIAWDCEHGTPPDVTALFAGGGIA